MSSPEEKISGNVAVKIQARPEVGKFSVEVGGLANNDCFTAIAMIFTIRALKGYIENAYVAAKGKTLDQIEAELSDFLGIELNAPHITTPDAG